MDMNTTQQVIKSIDIIAMMVSATVSWALSIGSFLIGVSKISIDSIMQKNKHPDFQLVLKVIFIPFLYMSFGVIIFQFFRVFIELWYNSSMNNNIISFFQFQAQNYQYVGRHYISLKKIEDIINIMKNIMLTTSVIIYLLIYVFYFYQASRFLKMENIMKMNSLWGNIFASFLLFIGSILTAHFYDMMASSALIPQTIHFQDFGDVNSIHQLLQKTVKYYAIQALSII